jgi:carboxypeptidase C (cathepsin A)
VVGAAARHKFAAPAAWSRFAISDRRCSTMPLSIPRLLIAAACLAAWPAGLARAQDAGPPCAAPISREAKWATRADENHLPADITTSQALPLDGRCLKFQATAGSMRLADEHNAPQADVAFIAYTLDDADPAERPVTFAINGGPGAASAWLNLGAIGPWRLPMAKLAPSSPPILVDNAETWLDFTDLVFIDPPGTGYSRVRALNEEGRRALWSVDGDIDALGVVIRRWLAAHGRLESPKFIVGESYGGFRGPLLAKNLASEQGVGISGLILISPVLDFARFHSGPDDPFGELTRLPSYAAAFREQKGPVARADLADVEQYATGDFLRDWILGPRDGEAVDRIERRVAELTGLDLDVVRRYGGRIGEWDFLREFKRAEGLRLAFYDATIAARDPFPTHHDSEALDPVLPGFEAPFTSAIVTLYQEKLGWKIEDRYELLNEEVGKVWNWGKRLSPPNAIGALRQMLALDPNFRVAISHGLTDVHTPYFATALELAQIPDLGPAGRLTLNVYPGGHMHYSRDDTRKALRDEARRVILGP